MSKYTNNYNLIKPQKSDNYDIEDVTNKNADIIDIELNKRVEKIPGKSLSTNDFTDSYKTKLDGAIGKEYDDTQIRQDMQLGNANTLNAANLYTDEEISKIPPTDLNNYYNKTESNNKFEYKDNTIVKDSNYIHTDNNFSNIEKNKLASLENYNDTQIKVDITALKSEISGVGTVQQINIDLIGG